MTAFLHRCQDYYQLCKPRVVALMLITSLVGMLLATPSGNTPSLSIILIANLGIALAAGSGAAINHIIDQQYDRMMSRTKQRPLITGKVSEPQAKRFAATLAVLSMVILITLVNALTALLTLAALIGYAFIYSKYLKHATPQNIVLGGLAGALPPLLGWTAITNHIDPNALLLVLIIFVWTPPHFWALAIYRYKEYKKANIPMFPVIYGIPATKSFIIFYSLLLLAVGCLPYATGLSGIIYLIGNLLLGGLFLIKSIKLKNNSDPKAAFALFRYSIIYLLLLFIVLLLDHYFTIWA